MLDAELGEVTWIAGTAKPTVADIALYSYIDRAPEVNVDLTAYANVNAWLCRVEELPGFLPFEKTHTGLE